MTRLAIFMSHPIQYQISLLRNIAKNEGIDLLVSYYWDFGINESYDPEFGSKIKWDLPLLDGYKSRFITNYAKHKSTSFFGCINPGVVPPILRKEFDVVLIFGWALFSNWLVVLAAFFSRTPILLCAESPLSHEVPKKGFFGKIRRGALKTLFSMTSGFLYIGQENRLFYESFGISPKKLFFAPYAVDNTRHVGTRKETPIERSAVAPVKILFVGKLIEKKRPMDLLQAFHRLQGTLGESMAALWFVGSGNQQADLENYVSEHQVKAVTFWGFQNQTELPRFYASADIFVLPSGYGETWGLVVNEAMCHGKPVIVSDLVGCGRDLVTGNNGFRFPYKDVPQLAEALGKLVSDSALRSRFGQESFRIIQGYSQEVSAGNITNAAKKVAQGIGAECNA
jgi:glycosyltransferase involved in cell wall biosynthesis